MFLFSKNRVKKELLAVMGTWYFCLRSGLGGMPEVSMFYTARLKLAPSCRGQMWD